MMIHLSENEEFREKNLSQYDIPDRQDLFQEITSLAASICETPLALLCLVDGSKYTCQSYQSQLNIKFPDLPWDIDFYTHAILNQNLLIIPDTWKNSCFAKNPICTFSPYVRFYAGAPLISPSGYGLGALCVFDLMPRDLNKIQSESLGILARQVTTQLDLRRNLLDCIKANQKSEKLSTQASQKQIIDPFQNRRQMSKSKLHYDNSFSEFGSDLPKENYYHNPKDFALKSDSLKPEIENNLTTYLNLVEESVFIIQNGQVEFVNQEGAKTLGYTISELLGKKYQDLIAPEDREKILDFYYKHLQRQNIPYEYSFQMLHKNQQNRILVNIKTALINYHGEFAFIALVKKVITASNDNYIQINNPQETNKDFAENIKQQQENTIHALLKAFNDAALIINQEGIILNLNQKAAEIFQRNPENIIGIKIEKLLSNLAATNLQEKARIALDKNEIVYFKDSWNNKELELNISVILHTENHLTRLVILARDISHNKILESKIFYQALHDNLTGLPNRVWFIDKLGQTIEQNKFCFNCDNIKKCSYNAAVLFINLDHFKMVQYSLGLEMGDQLLSAVSRHLEACLGNDDYLARLGTEDFAILLNNLDSLEAANEIADKIHNSLISPFYIEDQEVFTTASIGIVFNIVDYDRPVDILRDASIAMQDAKAAGGGCHQVFIKAMHTKAVERLQLENQLRRALDRQEFQVYYQPIVSLATGKLTGFEALIRWYHPDRGLVSPASFIPLAEATGLIRPIGVWVMREAFRQLHIWQQQFPSYPNLTMAVNLSAKQLTSDLLLQIDDILQTNELNPHSLKLEITESVLMENPEASAELLQQIKLRQIQLCLDDFGTGYSSLSFLHRFPINTIKIDRSFVNRIGIDEENAEIMRAVITLAHNLGMDAIAEGIETQKQLMELWGLGCEYGQGYFFSKPIDAVTASMLLANFPIWQ